MFLRGSNARYGSHNGKEWNAFIITETRRLRRRSHQLFSESPWTRAIRLAVKTMEALVRADLRKREISRGNYMRLFSGWTDLVEYWHGRLHSEEKSRSEKKGTLTWEALTRTEYSRIFNWYANRSLQVASNRNLWRAEDSDLEWRRNINRWSRRLPEMHKLSKGWERFLYHNKVYLYLAEKKRRNHFPRTPLPINCWKEATRVYWHILISNHRRQTPDPWLAFYNLQQGYLVNQWLMKGKENEKGEDAATTEISSRRNYGPETNSREARVQMRAYR